MHNQPSNVQEFMENGEQSRAEIQRSLGKIEGKLDSISVSFIQHLMDDKENFVIIGTRLSDMTKKLYAIGATVTLLVTLITGVMTIGFNHFK